MKLQLIKKTGTFLLILFIALPNMFGQTVQEKISNAKIGEEIVIRSYPWRIAKREIRNGVEYTMLYGMRSFHYAKFGDNNVYNSSLVRAAFTKRYATDTEYIELRQIAVVPELGNGEGFGSKAISALPAQPQLASALGKTEDIIFLPTVEDIRDWQANYFNVAATFGIADTHYRLITRNPLSSPAGNICGFLTQENKTLDIDAGISATPPNNAGYKQYRPSIWVKSGSIEPTVGVIVAPAALCAGESLVLNAPTVNNNGAVITAQGWQIGSAGNFSAITLPYTVSNNDNGKKLRYYVVYSGGTVYSNEVTLTVTSGVAPTIKISVTY